MTLPATSEEIAIRLNEDGRHASVIQVARYFAWSHLPPKLQGVSQLYCGLMIDLLIKVPDSPELTVALRKLLESKDAAVRAAVD